MKIHLKAIIVFIFLALSSYIQAQGLKKVLILDFNNIENNPNHQYLESSITDAVAKMLKDRFAFMETPRSRWETVGQDNFIYKTDYYTKTAAMNLGLLARQDVVISGGYKVYKKKEEAGLTIETSVRILDISAKRVISEFMIDGPADNRIWVSINKIAERISREAESILPNKEEWQRSGMKEEAESLPLITNVSFGLRAGGFLYHKGWAEYFDPQQPALGVILRGNTPFIWERLAVQIDFYYMKHELKEGSKTRSQSLGLKGDTSNYFSGLFLMADFRLPYNLRLHPKIGGGYVIQSTSVTGKTSDNFTNSLPFAGAGVDLSYEMNKSVDLVLAVQEFAEFETGVTTYVSNVNLGINLKF